MPIKRQISTLTLQKREFGMRNAFFIIGMIACIIVISCDNKKGLLPPKSAPLSASACDSIKYSNGIKAILDANCATSGCHDNITMQSNLNFSLYSTAQTQAQAGRIKARAIDVTQTPMPPSGLLSQSKRDSIQCWLDKGAPF